MITVAGATGTLGSEIVRRLRERGAPVRALVRATSVPEQVARLKAIGAEIAVGDLNDPASLAAACAGAATVISTVSIITTAQPGDSFPDTESRGTRSLISAAKKAGVGHFIFVSFDASNAAQAPDSPLKQAKGEVEEHLMASGIPYTILHPGLFMESWLGPMLAIDLMAGTAKVLGAGTDPVAYVAVADVAEVAVQSVYRPEARNATIMFGGPERISQRAAIQIFEEERHKPLSMTEIPVAALEAQWQGASNPFEKAFAALMLGVGRGFGDAPPPPDGFHGQLVTVRDYARLRCAAGAA